MTRQPKTHLLVSALLTFVLSFGMSTLALDRPEAGDDRSPVAPGVELNEKSALDTPELAKGDGETGSSKNSRASRRGRQARRGEGGRPAGQTEGDGSDDDGDGPEEKITICHKPGKPAEKTLVIPISALEDHLGHGDTIGPCPGDETPTES